MQDREGSLLSFLRELPFLIILAVVIAWFVKSFIFQPFYIPSGSMEPTLLPQDRVIVNKFIYRFRPPQKGDIVVFVPPNDLKRDYIKRVVAVGGETLEIIENEVYINGKKIVEPYRINSSDFSHYGPIKVPKNCVFVMGDNRPNSLDSRVFGPLKTSQILGKAIAVYWPPWRIKIL